jgi:hypothetical protein
MASIFTKRDKREDAERITSELDIGSFDFEGANLDRAPFGNKLDAGFSASAGHRRGEKPTSEETYNGSRSE